MLQKLPTSQAITLWHKFTSSHSGIVPFSFNPSLYNFYQKHFSWEPYYILVFCKEEVCGILPLVNTGKAWVSLPHMSYGGILAVDEFEHYSFKRIIYELKQKNSDAGFYFFKLEENMKDNSNLAVNVFIRTIFDNHGNNFHKTEKATSILNLPETEDLLSTKIFSNLKRKIRKAQKTRVKVQYGGEELINDFYKVYCRNIFALNSLNYSKRMISDLFITYKFGVIKIFIAYN